MIQKMSGGGFKVFTEPNAQNETRFLGAFTEQKLAEEVNRLGRPITLEEFNTLFGVTHEDK